MTTATRHFCRHHGLSMAYLVFAVLCVVLYRKVHVSPGYAGLTLLASLGLFVRAWRIVVLIFTVLVGLVLAVYFYAFRLLGNHNPLKLIPDLVAVVADTNQGEILAGLANLGSKYEYLSALFLLAAVALFVLSRPRAGSLGRPWLAPALWIVSVVSMGVLMRADGFVLQTVYRGLQDARAVYAENVHRIQARAGFQWGARAGYAGPDAVVLVLGETARGDRLGLNGYHRETTPRLARQPGLISFSDAISNAAYTLQSTPIILTRSQGELASRIYPEKSLISAFAEAGYETWYVSYLDRLHGGDSAINLIVQEAAHYVHNDPPEGQLADLAGLQAIQRILAVGHTDDDLQGGRRGSPHSDPNEDGRDGGRRDAGHAGELVDGRAGGHDAPRKRLIVFKMLGSHFNYQDRYDDRFEVFTPSYRQVPYGLPTPADKPILDNTYDNTILKTDYVLSELIDALQATPGRASLAFISDHGSAIFEDGHSLYGGRTPYNYDVPLLFWLKPGYFDDERQASLLANKDQPVDSTCLLDTLLAIADVDTALRKGCNLAAGRIQPRPRQVILGDRMVDYDAYFGRAAAGGAPSDSAMK